MSEKSRKDIRALLKEFGVRADEAIVAHLAAHPDGPELAFCLKLEDRTDYGDNPPSSPLSLVVEGRVGR